MSKIKIALVGCGRISANHLRAIEDNASDFELVAVCDTDEDKAKAAAQQFNVPYFLQLESMLQQSEELGIALISLCTPSGLHPAQSVLISQAGINVLTEKPMACKLQDAKDMIAAAAQAQTKLFVVKQNRLNPTIVALKKAIDSGDFGQIYMVHSNVFWTRPQEYYDHASWRGTWELDGGAFMNQASHYVDLLEYLIGPVEIVHAITKTLARKIEAEDSGVVNFMWKSGAIGSMAVTMLTYPKNLQGSITILGEKGSVLLDGVALNDIKCWQFESSSVGDVTKLSYHTDSVYGNGHGPYYKNVADVMLRGENPISDGVSGCKSIKLLDAIYRSAKTGEQIVL